MQPTQEYMNFYPKNKLPVREVKKFVLIFYLVGLLGFLLPFSKNIFIAITPFALLLSTYLAAIYHEDYTRKSVLIFLLIFTLGYFIEVIGVNTGLIFGQYAYGKGLGIKLLNTPLMIGVNWLFLTYTSISIVQKLKLKQGYTILLAPLLMVLYDIILEQLAPVMDMWSWQGAVVPLRNYVAWYLFAVVFVAIFRIFRIDTRNPLAGILFYCQFLFFVLLKLLIR